MGDSVSALPPWTFPAISMSLATRLFDYVRVVVPNYNTLNDALWFLPWEFSERSYGIYRYKSSAVAFGECVKVAWDGCQEGMGVMVDISGQALRDLESRPGFDWEIWLGALVEAGASFARLDVALDDRGASVSLSDIEMFIKQKHCTTRATTFTQMTKTTKEGSATTFYVGSRQSESMLRIYQKGLQLKEHDWLRFEFELKDRKANEWVSVFLDKGWDQACSLLRSVIDFTEPSDTKSVASRRTVAQWWIDLVAKSKAKFSPVAHVVDSIGRRVAWLNKQVSSSIWALMEVQGWSIDWVLEIARDAALRPNERARRLVAIAKNRAFSNDFTKSVALSC